MCGRGCRVSLVPAVRLIITILCGTRAGQRLVVAEGDALRVGRTTKADFVIADDPTMSAIHFELRCGDETACIRDLQSRNGLFINGEPVDQAVLGDGDQIRAGRTFFDVCIHGELKPSSFADSDDETRAARCLDATRMTPPLRPAPSGPAPSGPAPTGPATWPVGTSPSVSGADGVLRDDQPPAFDSSTVGFSWPQDRLYAVVDGAVGQKLIQVARNRNLRSASLAGGEASGYLSAAPCLIEVSHDTEFMAAWHSLRDRGHGVLIESRVEFEELVVHLRGMDRPPEESSGPSSLRFYDPEQLYAWLKGCTPPEMSTFFGCLTSVVLPLDAGSRLLRLTKAHEDLAEEEVQAG